MAKDFLILWAVCAAAVGGILGLCMYIGYRAGYAKAISTIKFGMEVVAHEREHGISKESQANL